MQILQYFQLTKAGVFTRNERYIHPRADKIADRPSYNRFISRRRVGEIKKANRVQLSFFVAKSIFTWNTKVLIFDGTERSTKVCPVGEDGAENAPCAADRNALNTFACLKINSALVHYRNLNEEKEYCQSRSLFRLKEFFITKRNINQNFVSLVCIISRNMLKDL